MRPRRRVRTAALPLRIWRARHAELLAWAGLVLAVAAAAVTLTRPAPSVYLTGDTVHVGDLTLTHPSGNGGLARGRLYMGPAALLVVSRPDGSIIASAVTYLAGQRATGVCTFGPPTAVEVSERCALHIGEASVTCQDVLRFDEPGSWRRQCSDGQALSVSVPAGAEVIPMPFPLGR